jgi:hypothetical protein
MQSFIPHGPYQWTLLFSCIAGTYLCFRGICAVLYDICGWILERMPPKVDF